MIKNKADTKKAYDAFVPNIIEQKEIYFFRYPSEQNSMLTCEAHEHFFDQDENDPMGLVPIWSSKYLPYAKIYGDGLELNTISIEEFYYSFLRTFRTKNPITSN